MEIRDAPACARMACDSEIGERYGFEIGAIARNLAGAIESGAEVFVTEADGAIAGFAWAEPKGAFSSAPYLRLIAVDGRLRGGGIGSSLLGEFERRTAGVGRDFCLLVSDFNADARAFYARHGYREVGALPNFARPGIAEIFMVKPRGLWLP